MTCLSKPSPGAWQGPNQTVIYQIVFNCNNSYASTQKHCFEEGRCCTLGPLEILVLIVTHYTS